jgi:trehalose 2-sulfotransferase
MWLRYLTNGPEFDFPPFAGLPPVRYVLASTPRSGSNMLARTLWHTGVAGFAEDYFADEHVLDYFERWGFAAGDEESMLERYVQMLMTVRTSPNGVFGVKVHAPGLRHLEIDVHDLLLSPQYIWIQRRDRLGQAISYTMAEQTGAWILDGTYLPLRETVAEPRYSYADIRRHLLLLDHGVTAWEEYFDRRNLSPHVVVYEDLLENYEQCVLGCLKSLGVAAPGQVPDPGIRRQANETNLAWAQRYERDAARGLSC